MNTFRPMGALYRYEYFCNIGGQDVITCFVWGQSLPGKYYEVVKTKNNHIYREDIPKAEGYSRDCHFVLYLEDGGRRADFIQNLMKQSTIPPLA